MSDVATPVPLGSYGVWIRERLVTEAIARGLEEQGYGALWLGAADGEVLEGARIALGTTRTLSVATGIVNIWTSEARATAASYHRLEELAPGRFLLGIGAGHREANGPQAIKPLQAMSDYLDVLDHEGVPADRRVLAALGPRMLRLSAERAAGAHPYLVNPDYTRSARATLGERPLLAPEHKVALAADREEGLSRAREGLDIYLRMGMQNYLDNFRRLGFEDRDFEGGGSERLLDAMVAQGAPAAIAAEVRRHLDAGADHVPLHPVHDAADVVEVMARIATALELR
ncbi:TIGR03620 family F420-dependent LLM class oxidoreductase [Nocardioides sp. Iso805N]|uniref:TIGR03620 family F420-dependent LLM class oxidoreductase n=1 Tax=Nocardioides sp. Iso805N TaxID=1283287 RepID=UPI00036A1449|nr:TIGR03620 family F420-dependent LLM class oxidoreductase [Nocardioides sp. Iso805N]